MTQRSVQRATRPKLLVTQVRVWLLVVLSVAILALLRWRFPERPLDYVGPRALLDVGFALGLLGLVLIAALGLGRKVLDWSRVAGLTGLEWGIFSLLIGLGAVAYGVLGLGLVGLLERRAILIWLGIAMALGAGEWADMLSRLPTSIAAWPRRIRALGLVNWLLVVLVLAAASVKVAYTLWASFNIENERRTLPVDVVEWIQERRPAGQMFNSYNWGGYLIWKLWPDYLVFVDGRTDLYGDSLLGQYLQVRFAQPGFQEVLDEYDISFVLIEVGGFTDNFLALDDSWTLAHSDDVAAVYVRAQ